MRVLLVSNLYPPYWIGGYEQVASWVADGLRARGHQVCVLTSRGESHQGRAGLHAGLDLDAAAVLRMHVDTGIRFPSGAASSLRRHVWSPANFRACQLLLERLRPDLVSFWNAAFITYSPLLAARLRGVPAVLHLSDAAANPFRSPHPPSVPDWLRGLARVGVDLALRASRARLLTAPSRFLVGRLVEREGLPADRTRVLAWPVEPTIDGLAPPRPAGLEPPRRLLFVGSLVPEKGVQVLIDAFRLGLRARPDLTLTLVGEGPRDFVARLRDGAAGLPVRLAGRLERAAVIEAYRSHDLLVFPSLWEEPFAVVPLEAMAMGLAVIATRTGGTPEAVMDGETGRLVPAGDARALAGAILGLVADPGRAGALAARGQAWARRERGCARFIDAIEEIYAGCATELRRAA